MAKDGILLTCSATSIADAMINITNHPSKATDDDNEHVSRTAKHWIQRALNNITGSGGKQPGFGGKYAVGL